MWNEACDAKTFALADHIFYIFEKQKKAQADIIIDQYLAFKNRQYSAFLPFIETRFTTNRSRGTNCAICWRTPAPLSSTSQSQI